MKKIALVIHNENASTRETATYLAEQGYTIYQVETLQDSELAVVTKDIQDKEGALDLLLLGTNEALLEDGSIRDGHKEEELLDVLDNQINGIRAAIEYALPLLRKGEGKRIGLITKSDSSISLCRCETNYGRHMVLAGLNMVGKIYFNLLRPEGFTFRWYCAGTEKGGMSAGEYLLAGLCYDPKEPYIHSDENRFVMRDNYLREIPW